MTPSHAAADLQAQAYALQYPVQHQAGAFDQLLTAMPLAGHSMASSGTQQQVAMGMAGPQQVAPALYMPSGYSLQGEKGADCGGTRPAAMVRGACAGNPCGS
jgi:hypothetical protein